MKTRVLKLEVLIVNHDGLSDEEIKSVVENTKYPNWCISPEVLKLESREVDWSDDHPLNKRSTRQQAIDELFQ